jgi:long-chain acyl-CoA synthetase
MNSGENLSRSTYYFPDRLSIIEESRKIFYLEFNEESNRVATALMGLGLQKGNHMALCAPNVFSQESAYLI